MKRHPSKSKRTGLLGKTQCVQTRHTLRRATLDCSVQLSIHSSAVRTGQRAKRTARRARVTSSAEHREPQPNASARCYTCRAAEAVLRRHQRTQ